MINWKKFFTWALYGKIGVDRYNWERWYEDYIHATSSERDRWTADNYSVEIMGRTKSGKYAMKIIKNNVVQQSVVWETRQQMEWTIKSAFAQLDLMETKPEPPCPDDF